MNTTTRYVVYHKPSQMYLAERPARDVGPLSRARLYNRVCDAKNSINGASYWLRKWSEGVASPPVDFEVRILHCSFTDNTWEL